MLPERYALTLALLIFAERQQRAAEGGLEFATYVVLDRAADLASWSEERRADLYARIVEACAEIDQTRFLQIEKACTAALQEHTRAWRT